MVSIVNHIYHTRTDGLPICHDCILFRGRYLGCSLREKQGSSIQVQTCDTYISNKAKEAEDLQEVIDDYRRLTRELDVALNGDGSAKQASLCDIVAQVKREKGAPKAASQSAEELAYKLADHGTIRCGHEDCKACPEHLKEWVKDIEADRAAQRQAGREEARKELREAAYLSGKYDGVESMQERYAAVVEVLEEILPVEAPGEGLAPYYIHSDTIKRARKALSDLDKVRKE